VDVDLSKQRNRKINFTQCPTIQTLSKEDSILVELNSVAAASLEKSYLQSKKIKGDNAGTMSNSARKRIVGGVLSDTSYIDNDTVATTTNMPQSNQTSYRY